MSIQPQKKEFLEGKKTYLGIGIAYIGFELVPVLAQMFGEIGTSLGGNLGEAVTRAGMLLAVLGKAAADARAKVLALQLASK